MKKFIKTIVLLPMWPLIWIQMGFSLDPHNCYDDGYTGCSTCAFGDGCCRRARAMVKWWRA